MGPARVSSDGTRVAFQSGATNLDPADTDDIGDVYVKDLVTGDLTLASTSDTGEKGNGSSGPSPSLSADGTYVAFTSLSTNLDPADTDDTTDVYVKDLVTGDITLASTSDTGVKGDGESAAASLSADGTKVAFQSAATNLDPADTDPGIDVYVKDLLTGDITLASTDDAGAKGDGYVPILSADGTAVGFTSFANMDPDDTDFDSDAYVKDLVTGETTVASINAAGVKGNGQSNASSLSADGTMVAFTSAANNLDPRDTTDGYDDVYVKNLTTGELVLASTTATGEKANLGGIFGRLSADGTRIVFLSESTNLHPADTDTIFDAFVKDLLTGDVTLASTSDTGTKANDESFGTEISADGNTVAFASVATNLDPADTDAEPDVYVKDIASQSPAAADLTLTLTDSTDPVRRGQRFTYTIRITNTGPDAATDVVATDTLPTGLRLLSATSPTGTCEHTGRVVTCNLGNLAPGDRTTVRIAVTGNTQGTRTNTATVTASEPDPDPTNNTDTETTTVR